MIRGLGDSAARQPLAKGPEKADKMNTFKRVARALAK